jgi:asparagine synthase (glutamine-hydrolysing)
MCGIVGIGSATQCLEPALVGAMRETLRHRGPDDAGTWQSADGQVCLGHRRLAVIDLSPGGHQPMVDGRGQLVVTFNGEIYNYRALRHDLEKRGHQFRTASDTEIILEAYRAWGSACLQQFNGMFAFCLYDAGRGCLFLARDRAGEKPLFYRHARGRLTFASELKALLADPDCPRRVDRRALDCYLAFGYVPGSLCILEGVHKLPAGHALSYDLRTGAQRVWPYWTLPERKAGPCPDRAALVDELDGLLLDAVRLRLAADVPVGIMLSGGIDSSLVTAMAARVSARPVKTFTISFPGHPRHDEACYARLVARHFGTEHVELPAAAVSVELLPELACQYDEPMADSSMVPTYLVSRLIRQHATVALGGDGADELFGGYPSYSWLRLLDRAHRVLPRAVRGLIGACAARFWPLGLRGRNYLLGLRHDIPYGVACAGLFFDSLSRRRLLAPLGRGGPGPDGAAEAYKVALCQPGQSVLQQGTAVDFKTYLADDILVKVDRASMLASLEVRAPWLDPRIIELAFARVPDELRATRRESKILPRSLAARLLPPQLDLRRKQGFVLPMDNWFRGPWGRYMESVLMADSRSWFNRDLVRRLLARQRRGYVNGHRLFSLTMFELWRHHYQVTVQ